MTLYHQLSPKEKYIYQCFLCVKHDSIWGVAIQRFIDEPTPSHLRQLIDEISQAARDNPEAMTGIVGKELMDMLVPKEVTQVV